MPVPKAAAKAFQRTAVSHYTATGNVPVQMHMNEHLFRGQGRRRVLGDLLSLRSIATLTGTVHVMPDLAREDDESLGVPVGVTFTTGGDDPIVVPAGSPDTGCGYRILVARGANIHNAKDFDREMVLNAMASLPTRWNDLRGNFDLASVFRDGATHIVERGMGDPNDLLSIEHGGCVPNADPTPIPDVLLEIAQDELGRHGHNGHFVELMRVEHPLTEGPLRRWGVTEGDLLLVLHTGSEVFGVNVFLRYFQAMARAYAEQPGALEDPLFYRGLFGLDASNGLGREYLGVVLSLMNFSYARRQLIGTMMAHTLNKALGLTGRTKFEILSDLSHVGIEPEPTPDGVQLRHRRGVQRLGDHATMICGEAGIPSFLVTAGPAASQACRMANHGMGRNHLLRKLTPFERECISFSSQVVCNQQQALYRIASRIVWTFVRSRW